jgi:hypothetical protein
MGGRETLNHNPGFVARCAAQTRSAPPYSA